MKNNFYDFYSKFYKLKKLKINISDKKVLFLIYDDENYYYLKNNKFLDTNKEIDILSLIDEYNDEYDLEIINYYPVCFAEKTLVIALKNKGGTNSLLEAIDYNNLESKYNSLIKYHLLLKENLFFSSNVKKEIQMSEKYINRYKIHEKIIKKYILTHKKRRKEEFKKQLEELIPDKKKSIIDISCGDNSDTFCIAKNKKYNYIVGNDICLSYLKNNKKDYVIYTNDDVGQNNIMEKSFDVGYCKNTLHHMNSISDMNRVLDFLDRISDTIIIIEIENPQISKGLPKFLNKYLYTKFLKDVGVCYLNNYQFKKIIDNKFKKCEKEYSTFTNVLGTYMICKITRKKA